MLFYKYRWKIYFIDYWKSGYTFKLEEIESYYEYQESEETDSKSGYLQLIAYNAMGYPNAFCPFHM